MNSVYCEIMCQGQTSTKSVDVPFTFTAHKCVILDCLCFFTWFIQFFFSFLSPPSIWIPDGKEIRNWFRNLPCVTWMLSGINELTYSKMILKGEVLYKCQAWLTNSQVIRHLNIMHLFWISEKWMYTFIFKSIIWMIFRHSNQSLAQSWLSLLFSYQSCRP